MFVNKIRRAGRARSYLAASLGLWAVASAAAGQTDATAASASDDAAPRVVTGLEHPESAVGGPDGRVFVSTIGAFEVDGDGAIVVIDASGKKVLASGLDDPKGIDLHGGCLYVADNTRVLRINMQGKVDVIAEAADFPRTPTFLNDLEIGPDGSVYVSDSGTEQGEGAGIYRIGPDGKVTDVTGPNREKLKRPNGLLMDGPGQLLVADFGTGELFRLELASGDLTKLNHGFGGADGLVRDQAGRLYVSDWGGGQVYRLASPRDQGKVIADGFASAADIGLSGDGEVLLVPDMKGGKLHFVRLERSP